MEKTKKRAFNRDLYLLGVDAAEKRYWLNEPVKIGNYWSFGVITSYSNNSAPNKAVKILTVDTIGKNGFGEWWDITHKHSVLKEAVFTEKEGFRLTELFRMCNFLSDAVECFSGNSFGYASIMVDGIIDLDKAMEINGKLIPEVTNQIINILKPAE